MVVGLFVLSLVMIVGGIASVVQGFPYVRLESGLVMVTGGATAASAGVILLGLAAAVQRLKGIEETLKSVRLDARAPSFLEQSVIPVAPSSVPPPLAEAVALAGFDVVPPPSATERSDGAPVDVPEPVTDRDGPPAPDETKASPEPEPPLPDLLPPDEPPKADRRPAKVELRDPPAPEPPAMSSPVEDDLFDEPPPSTAKGEPDRGALKLRSSLDDGSQPDEKPAEPVAKPPETPPVVGTYSSGGNTYVMFADGTIEADTPRGRFTFGSLEELKAFVEGGGEDGTRGAA